MPDLDLSINNGIIIYARGGLRADLGITEGRIALVAEPGTLPRAKKEFNAEGLHILPGIIDSHVHVRDPGLTHKEDFTTATHAAAAGGVTFLMAQPTTDPPTITSEAMEDRIKLGETKACIDFSIQAGVDPSRLDEIPKLAERGAASFEVFLQDYPEQMAVTDAAILWEALEAIKAVGGLAGIYRGEESLKSHFLDQILSDGRKDARSWVESRPDILEALGVSVVLAILPDIGTAVHFRQISTRKSIELILKAKESNSDLPVSIEVTPHNLLMSKEDFLEIGPMAKVIPPQRDEDDLNALWDVIQNDDLNIIIATDHAPHLQEDKEKGIDNIWSAPPGFPGVQTMLPLMLNQVAEQRLTLPHLVRLCSSGPAKRFGFYPRKGNISIGADADFVFVDMSKEITIKSQDQLTKAGFTPFDGWKVKGSPVTTIVRGQVVMHQGEIKVEPGFGKFVPSNPRHLA